MSWAKCDDRLLDNAKVRAVRAHAKLLYLASILDCAAGLTDGRVARDAVVILCAKCGLRPAEAAALAEELLQAGLWEARDGDLWVHDYLAYNPTRAEVLAGRARDADRKALGRAHGAGRVRSESARTPNGFRADSTRDSARNLSVPYPVPSPYPSLTPRGDTPVGTHTTDYEQVVATTSRARAGEGAAAAAGEAAASRPWEAAETEVAVALWERARPVVQARLHARNWATYLEGAQPLGVRDGELVLRVRSPALLDEAGRFVDLIAESLRGLDGAPRDVRLVATSG